MVGVKGYRYMNYLSFYNYDIKAEEPNGDYYKFVQLTDEELETLEGFINNICTIILQIRNNDLKERMKDRIIKYLKGKNLINNGFSFLETGLFNDDEIKALISSTDYLQIIKDNIQNNKHIDILEIIKMYFLSSDTKWIFKNVSEILSLAKDYDYYEALLIFTLELSLRKNKELFKIILDNYKSSITEYYLNYLKINSDRNYLYKKSMEYRAMHLKIGIDPKISIAPEIEANNKNGLTIEFYNQKNFGGSKYSNYSDATVPNGKEINCTPFHDTEEDLASFKAVCDSLKEIGYYYDRETGNASGQINLGLSYLDSAAAIINFYEIFGNVEELLFYISNKKGDLTRQSLYQNSRFKPIGEILGTRILDEDITRDEVIKLFNSTLEKSAGIKGLTYKKNTVCLRGENESNYRFEIRIPNGGVDYETWVDNIRLYGKMMEVAKKLADANKKDELTAEEEKMFNLKLDLEDESLSLKEKLDILMNLLFSDKKIQNIYYERFASVMDQIKKSPNSEATKKYHVPAYKYEPMFDEVEFQGKYQSKLDEKPVGVFDPETNEYFEYGERKHLR